MNESVMTGADEVSRHNSRKIGLFIYILVRWGDVTNLI